MTLGIPLAGPRCQAIAGMATVGAQRVAHAEDGEEGPAQAGRADPELTKPIKGIRVQIEAELTRELQQGVRVPGDTTPGVHQVATPRLQDSRLGQAGEVAREVDCKLRARALDEGSCQPNERDLTR